MNFQSGMGRKYTKASGGRATTEIRGYLRGADAGDEITLLPCDTRGGGETSGGNRVPGKVQRGFQMDPAVQARGANRALPEILEESMQNYEQVLLTPQADEEHRGSSSPSAA